MLRYVVTGLLEGEMVSVYNVKATNAVEASEKATKAIKGFTGGSSQQMGHTTSYNNDEIFVVDMKGQRFADLP
jgi:hypothetical protein